MRYSHIAEHFPFPSLNGRIIFSIRLPVDNSTKKGFGDHETCEAFFWTITLYRTLLVFTIASSYF